jgi:hypothetical protein
MYSLNLENNPDVFRSGWNIADDWKNLLKRAQKSRMLLQEIRENQKAPEVLSPFSYLTEELVVNTLRSSELPETVYWTLHYFAEANRQSPIIRTDRGKTVFIELDRLDDTITLYIGHTEELVCLGEEDGRKLFAMPLIDKYEFVRYPLLGSVLKRRSSHEAMEKWHKVESDSDNSTPYLFFTQSEEQESVACVKFADSETINKKAVYDASTSYLQTFHANHIASSFVRTFEISGNKFLSVFATHNNGKSDKSFPQETKRAGLSA